MKLYITYEGFDRHGVKRIPYRAIASNLDEAVKAIESWRTYGSERFETMVCNKHCIQILTDIFNGTAKTPVEFCTTGCGSYFLVFNNALGNTVEEHEANAEAKEILRLEAERAKAKYAKNKKFQLYSRITRGWYFVSIPLDLEDYEGARVYKTYSAYTFAESKMDACLKAIKDAEDFALKNGGLSLAHPITWDDVEVIFAGMKTDNGFSVEAWKEYQKQHGNEGTEDKQPE